MLEFGVGGKSKPVNTRQHWLFGITPPIASGDGIQFEAIRRDARSVLHVRPLAHVGEGSVRVKAEGLALGDQLLGVRDLEGLTHAVQLLKGLILGQFLPRENLFCLEDAPHAFFEIRKVGLGKRLVQEEIVVEARSDGRAETQLGVWTNLEHGLGQHMGEGMPEFIKPLFHPMLRRDFPVHDGTLFFRSCFPRRKTGGRNWTRTSDPFHVKEVL